MSVSPGEERDDAVQKNNEASSEGIPRTSEDIPRTRKTPSCLTLHDAFGKLFRIDDFSLELLGNGFFSEVFKVIHKVTGETMVLKKNTNSLNRPNILREVQLLNSLSHQNILRLMGACIHEGQVHALTEFINGGSLESILADEKWVIRWDQRINFANDISSGMKYLHSKEIMHRDLTSKNVLVRIKGEEMAALISDLGLATKIPKSQGTRLSIVGSPYWMAPECIQGFFYNEKADVFSYGIILCEIIARIEADPDILPRTANFGVDYIAFGKMTRDCPISFLHHAYNCLQIQPEERPTFCKICENLKIIKRSNMAVVLADITKLKAKPDMAVNKTILEKILIGRGLKRNMSDEAITIQIPDISEVAVLETVDRADPSAETVTVHFSVRPKPRPHDVDGRKVFSVTKETVGQVMSRDDPYYLPHQDNPFCGVFKDGRAKLMGSRREHWGPLLDLHWPSGRDREMAEFSGCVTRRSISLPNSPPLTRRDIDVKLNDSLPPFVQGGKMEDGKIEGTTDDIDGLSEGASSTDSAVGLEPVTREPMYVRFPSRYFGLRKFSIDPGVISGSSDRPSRVNRTDLIARQLEAQVLDDALQRRFKHSQDSSTPDDNGPCSFSSSESCMSLDESSIMSPTSSYSSYTDNDSEIWFNRAQLELYEHRLRSRERFQELVRRWEEKQGRSVSSNKANTLSPAAALRPYTSQRPLLVHERSPDLSDPGMGRHFQDLRHKWESKQISLSQEQANRTMNSTKQLEPNHEQH